MRRTAAEIAAAALYELFPGVELLGGGASEVGFTYEFVFPHPVHEHIIEEKMRQIVREKREIRTLEMVPFSASELLNDLGLFARAEAIEEKGLVEVVQMGAFFDLSLGPHLKNTGELAAFKISLEPLTENRIRIRGWCAPSKGELKQFLKVLRGYQEPFDRGESLGFWKKNIWLALGLKKRESLIGRLKKEWFEGVAEVAGRLGADRYELHQQVGQKRVGEVYSSGLFETKLAMTFFALLEGEMISSLHSIGKTLTIMGFDHSTSQLGGVTDFTVVDQIGRRRILVRSERRGNDIQITAHIERMMEQMLEQNLWVKLENQ